MPADPRFPNLLVAGAMRCGTTSAFRYLEAHPEIYMSPVKEPAFLAYDGARPTYTGPGDDRLNTRVCTDLEEYLALFSAGSAARWRGEATAMYLYLPEAVEGLTRYRLEPFVLLLLRDPAERAYSAFEYLRRQGREPLATLAGGLDAEPDRRAQGWSPMWHYLEAGRYTDQVIRWQTAVGAANVHVVLYEDLERDPQATFVDVFARLGVDPDAPIDYAVHNQSGAPRSVFVERMTRRAGPWRKRLKRALPSSAKRAFERIREGNIQSQGTLDGATRDRLVEELDDDVARLEDLLGRQLTSWRSG